MANRRAERTALWQDSTFFQDSFFAPDSRMDGFGGTEFGSLTGRALAGADAERQRRASPANDLREGGGVVVDEEPGYAAPTRH